MAYILALIAGIIVAILLNRKDNQTAKQRRELIKQIERINYLLGEIPLWEKEGLIAAKAAQDLAQRYEAKKRSLLGLPENSPEQVGKFKELLERVKKPQGEVPLTIAPEGDQREPLQKPKGVRPRPKKQRAPKPSFNLLNFLQEKNIKWFNALGTLMLLAAGIIFVATNWESWSGPVKSLIMVLVMAFFFLAGYFIKNKLDLPNSGLAFYLVGSLFLPLSLISFNNFLVFGIKYPWSSYLSLTALIAFLFYAFMAYKLKSQIFCGLSALAGGAGLFSLLTYFNFSYSRAGIFFIPLSLVYFLIYYLIITKFKDFKETALPLMLGANVMAAVGLGLSAVDWGFALFTTAVIASLSYLVSTYLFKRLEYLYVFIGVMALSIFPGVGYFHLPGRAYNLSFILIAGVSLSLSYLNRRLSNKQFEKHFFYTMIGSTALAAAFIILGQINLFTQPLKYNQELVGAIITLLGGAVIYWLSAYFHKEKRFTYVAIVSFFAGYVMALMYFGINGKLYALFFLGLAAVFELLSRLLKNQELFTFPLYLSGIITNALVTVLLAVLVAANPQIFRAYDANLLAAILALLLNAAFYLYLSLRSSKGFFTYGATGVTYFNLILVFNWFGLGEVFVTTYLMPLVLVYLYLEKLVKLKELFVKPLRFSALGANIITTILIAYFAVKLSPLEYSFLTLGLLLNAFVYFYLAFVYRFQALTWAGILPAALAYAHFIHYFRFDPDYHYLGLEIMLFALGLCFVGGLLVRKGLRFYYLPLLIAGFSLSVLGVGAGFLNGDTLIYPALLATLLYALTAYLLPVYREWFWRGALVAANISFGAIIYKLNPNYDPVDYARYFIIFNLIKFALGFYFQYFENNMRFAVSHYLGIAITSLASLAITFLSGDPKEAATVWLVYGLVYFALAYLLTLQIPTYVSSLVLSFGLVFALHWLGVVYDQVFLYVAGLSFIWIALNVVLKNLRVYALPLRIIVPVSIALPFIYNTGAASHDTAMIGSVLATFALLAQGKLQAVRWYYFVAPLTLIGGYESFLLKYNVKFQELYLAPVSLYLIALSFLLKAYNRYFNYLSYLGILAFMLVSYLNSFSGRDFLLHALVLGIAAFVSILLGAALKHRGFFFLGIIFLLADVITQSRSFLWSLQKWFWIGLGGSMFLALGLLFDKKRKDRTLDTLNRQLEKYKTWN